MKTFHISVFVVSSSLRWVHHRHQQRAERIVQSASGSALAFVPTDMVIWT